MQILPPALENLVEAFGLLPGVGPKTAERYAYYLTRQPEDVSLKISHALKDLKGGIAYCQMTFALIPGGETYSRLYTDPGRDKTTVAVVADPYDVIALEKTGNYRGTYHVLGGVISPIDDISPSDLNIDALIKRIDQDKVKEIILATNASVEGESTALYIQQQLGTRKCKITRLAQGLSVGVDLEYADQLTLSRALENRQAI